MSDIILYTFIGILAVLVVMNAQSVATAITAGGGVLTTESKNITGKQTLGA